MKHEQISYPDQILRQGNTTEANEVTAPHPAKRSILINNYDVPPSSFNSTSPEAVSTLSEFHSVASVRYSVFTVQTKQEENINDVGDAQYLKDFTGGDGGDSTVEGKEYDFHLDSMMDAVTE